MSKGNMFLGMARGKVGDIVFSRRLGQQVTRAYVPRVNDAATRSQVAQRSRLGNLVSSYRAFRTLLQRAFESKPAGNTDYNMFVGANLSGSQVYLSAEAVAAGACVVAPYAVSKGTLPPIQVVEQAAGSFVSDIAVPAGFDITATTTVAQLTAAILSTNQDWTEGDQFTAVHAEQYVQAQTAFPMCSVRLYDVVLSSTDATLVRDLMPATVLSVINGFLGFTNPAFTGAITGIHSRLQASGALKVSSSQMLLTRNNTIYAQYSGAVAESIAVATRGFNQGVYLNPTSDHGQAGGSITPQVIITNVGGQSTEWNVDGGVLVNESILIHGSNLEQLDGAAVVSYWDGTNTTLGTGTVTAGGRAYMLTADNGKSIRTITLNGVILASMTDVSDGDIIDPGA